MIGCIDVGCVLWVFRNAKVVVEFDAQLSRPIHVLVVEMIKSSMSFNDMINTLAIIAIEKRFVEPDCVSYPETKPDMGRGLT